MKKVSYKGLIKEETYGEADDILYLGGHEDPLGEILEEDKNKYGSFATVRYYITDTQQSKEQLDENLIRKISGDIDADFGSHYSEYTGYLWTDEEFNVGGHDLIKELHSYVGKYLYMEIEWSKQKL